VAGVVCHLAKAELSRDDIIKDLGTMSCQAPQLPNDPFRPLLVHRGYRLNGIVNATAAISTKARCRACLLDLPLWPSSPSRLLTSSRAISSGHELTFRLKNDSSASSPLTLLLHRASTMSVLESHPSSPAPLPRLSDGQKQTRYLYVPAPWQSKKA
jgi:hypothetical protein